MKKNTQLLPLKLTFFTFTFVGILFYLFSCQTTSDCESPIDVKDIKIEVKITELEQEVFKKRSEAEVLALLKKHPELSQTLAQLSALPNEAELAKQFYALIKAPKIDELYTDCQEKFGDVKGLEKEFKAAFQHIKHYYPDFIPPKIYTLVTGFGFDLVVKDKVILIGKEYFLGKKAKYPLPPSIPEYQARRYKKAYIVANSLQFLAEKYVKIDDKDRTALAEMLYYGKTYYFVKNMIPCIPDSILTGYTAAELANINDNDNRKYIWGHLVEKKIFFSTNQLDIRNYLEERPFVAEINSKCPGRIGRWLGLRIIEKYAQKKKVSLQNILKDPNAKNIFTQSGYKGE